MFSTRIPTLVLLLAVTAACTASGAHPRPIRAVAAAQLPTAATLHYFADVKTALAPLLVHVRDLPATIDAVREKGAVSNGQAIFAAKMAFDFATARDLVGRLPVPREAPAPVGELMQLACQLYRTSALELQQGTSLRPGVVEGALRNATALQQLGDRIIDQVRRLLAVDHAGAEQLAIEYRYPDPVPSVTTLVGFAATARVASVDSLASVLQRSRRALALTGQLPRARAKAAAYDLAFLASRFETLNARSPEYVVTARIALLLGVLADDTDFHGRADTANVLDMLSRHAWNQAAALPGNALVRLSPSRLTRTQVWTGGVFNGSPPMLVAGQDIGSGVPGGLPEVDGISVSGG